MKELMR